MKRRKECSTQRADVRAIVLAIALLSSFAFAQPSELAVLAIVGGVSTLAGGGALIGIAVRGAEIDRELTELRSKTAGLELSMF